MNPPRSARGATFWVVVEKVAQQVFWLLLFIVMAPILGPRAYGQFALVMVFIGFCELILVDAATEALVSLTTVTRAHLGTALLANLAAAALVAAAAWLTADPISRAFDDPELAPLFRALAALPLAAALTAGPIALLRRTLAFRPLALRSIIGVAAGGAAGIALAVRGYGVWALVAQALVQRTVELLVLWIAQPEAVVLSWSAPCWRDMRAFARNVTIGRAMNWASGQTPRLIIGYVLGPVALGLFTLAGRAADALIQVAVAPRATVARIELIDDRDDPVRFEAHVRAMARDAAVIAFPAALGAAAVTPQLFAIWLDARWQDGVLPTQLMLLTAVPLLGFYLCSAGLMAANRADLEARVAIWQSASNALVTALAAPLGLSAVTAAMLLRLFAFLPLAFTRLAGAAGIAAKAVVVATLRILAAAAAMGLATYATGRLVALPGPGALQFALLVLEGIGLYAGLLVLVDRAAIRRLLDRRRTATPE